MFFYRSITTLLLIAIFLISGACATNKGVESSPTQTAQQLREERQTAAYTRTISPILIEYLTVLDQALETVSIDSTMATVQSFDSARTNLERILQHQDDIEGLSVSSEAIPGRNNELGLEMAKSFRLARQGLDAIYSVYAEFARNRGIPTTEALDEFAEQRSLAEGLISAALQVAETVYDESKSTSGSTSGIANSSLDQQTGSPEVFAALAELFWAGAAIAGIPRQTQFEEARTRLSNSLFDSLFEFFDEYEQIGIDYRSDWPFCINATGAADAIMSLSISSSPQDAGPDVNRAIERIVGMEGDIELARRTGARTPTQDSISNCARVLDEIMSGG
ncbi:MAG: hypothetical protein IIA92_05635 [Chloroflexi bacterium]|nr:hypothetical protein [Chloroflexota bacterium]